MAEVTAYAEIVKRILAAHAALKPSVGDITTELICDDQQGHYELLHKGWIEHRRVHGSVIHIDIRDGKIWIEHDGTSPGVAGELVEAGVPKEHIVLGFHAPYRREHTEFAVG
jgi:ketopantoate reductase